MLLHTKRQVFKILVFCNMRCFIMFVTAVSVLFLTELERLISKLQLSRPTLEAFFFGFFFLQQPVRERSACAFPEQRLVIEPK